MKISDQLITNTFHPGSSKNGHDVYFDALLNSSVKQNSGDEYYWQHQNQLQQSALRFNPLCVKHIEQLEFEPTETGKPCINLQTDTSDTVQQISNSSIKTGCEVIETALLPMIPEQSNKTVKAVFEQVMIYLENKLEDKLTRNDAHKLILSKQPIADTVIFKNHQLFIDNNVVELTLNTSQLSKDETSELQKLVKQWLANKGYILKQFIINGEIQ